MKTSVSNRHTAPTGLLLWLLTLSLLFSALCGCAPKKADGID